jgi:hypothetical protein
MGPWHTREVASTWPDSEAAGKLGIRSYAGVPVQLQDGTLYGTLCSASTQSIEVDEEVKAILSLCSDLLAHQIQSEQATQAADQRAAQSESQLTRVALLAEIGELCMEARSLLPAVAQTADHLRRLGIFRTIIPFQVIAGQPHSLDPVDRDHHELIQRVLQAFGEAVSRRHDEHNQPLLDDPDALDGLAALAQATGIEHPGAIGLLTAATVHDLQAGILVLADAAAEIEERDVSLLVNGSNYLSMLTDRLYHQGRLEDSNRELNILASRDNLTGLPNRRSLMESLEQLLSAAEEHRGQILSCWPSLTWTGSSASTTSMATKPVTCSWSRSPEDCSRPCAKMTWSPVWAAMNSSWSPRQDPTATVATSPATSANASTRPSSGCMIWDPWQSTIQAPASAS